jgi:methionine-gamma-lyase
MAEDEIFTKAVHAGEDPEAYHGALSVPIYQSAVFSFPDADAGAAIHEGERPGYFYGRMGNPTQAALERAMCELEGGQEALAFSSGMAAISTSLMTLLRPGDHIVVPEALYATTDTFFTEMLVPFGVKVTHVNPPIQVNI